MKMRQQIVGSYPFGCEYVEIVLMEGLNGEFYLIPEKGKITRIKIGGDHTQWNELVTVLVHELMELAIERSRCRYMATGDMGQDSGNCVFMFNHPQLSHFAACMADTLATAAPDVAKAWKQWKKG